MICQSCLILPKAPLGATEGVANRYSVNQRHPTSSSRTDIPDAERPELGLRWPHDEQ